MTLYSLYDFITLRFVMYLCNCSITAERSIPGKASITDTHGTIASSIVINTRVNNVSTSITNSCTIWKTHIHSEEPLNTYNTRCKDKNSSCYLK